MRTNILIDDGEKYGGKYIAIKSFKDRKVITYGKDAAKVYDEALKKGIKIPVVFFVPKKGMVRIY